MRSVHWLVKKKSWIVAKERDSNCGKESRGITCTKVQEGRNQTGGSAAKGSFAHVVLKSSSSHIDNLIRQK